MTFRGIIAIQLVDGTRLDDDMSYDRVEVLLPRVPEGATARDGSYVGHHQPYLKIPKQQRSRELDVLQSNPHYISLNDRFDYFNVEGYRVTFAFEGADADGRVAWRAPGNPEALLRMSAITPGHSKLDPRLLETPTPREVAACTTLRGGGLRSNLVADKFVSIEAVKPGPATLAFERRTVAAEVSWIVEDVEAVTVQLTPLRPNAQAMPERPDQEGPLRPLAWEKRLGNKNLDFEITNECMPHESDTDTDFKWYYNLLGPAAYADLDAYIDEHGALPEPRIFDDPESNLIGSSQTCYPGGFD